MVNWLRRMADLYDILDAQRPRDSRLLPLYHSQANAHLEITIHESGEFVDARLLKDSSQNNKDEEQTDVRLTLFPGSPPAISRSSNLTPRGLMDKISYLAGDMDEFLLDDEKGTFSRHNTAYMAQMQEWVESPHSNKTVQAVYHYLQKKCLLHDLAPTVVDLLAKGEFKKAVQDAHEQKQEAALLKQLLKFNEAKQRNNNVKVISDVVVRWCVIPESLELLDLPSNTWERQDIIEDWIAFMRDTFLPTAERGFDTIYGEEYVPLVRTWFPWVLSPTCNLSVISSNRGPEQYNFGVYDNASQNFSAGLEPADKALRALRYIIEVQGIRYCDKTGIVGAMAIWANGAKGVTLPFAGIKSSLSLFEENPEATDDAIGHDWVFDVRDKKENIVPINDDSDDYLRWKWPFRYMRAFIGCDEKCISVCLHFDDRQRYAEVCPDEFYDDIKRINWATANFNEIEVDSSYYIEVNNEMEMEEFFITPVQRLQQVLLRNEPYSIKYEGNSGSSGICPKTKKVIMKYQCVRCGYCIAIEFHRGTSKDEGFYYYCKYNKLHQRDEDYGIRAFNT